MGAFFLFKSTKVLDFNAVRMVFKSKGFSAPTQFTLNNMTLWLYKKQLVDEDNYYFSEKGSAVFATGTIIYKGRNYKDTLRSLVEDFETNRMDFSAIIGAFCLIFVRNGKLYVLTDRSNIYHVFINEDRSVLSSSFLALIAAQKGKLYLNKMTCLEQFMIGYSVGPETIIKGISIVNDLFKKHYKNPYYSFMLYPKNEENEDNLIFKNNSGCIDNQLKLLKHYYQQIGALAKDYSVDIGISGGYDSRLNFLLASSLPAKITAHTHFSKEHYKEKEIAELIVEEKNIRLRTLLISDPIEMSETKMVDNLSDSLHFYDGRTNQTMGTFNDVHTKKYRIAILDQNKLGLNGLGGELYRNHDYTCYNKLNFVEWIKYHVMDPVIVYSMQNKNYLKELNDYVMTKYINILNIRRTNYIDKYTARRYYAEIWLPYSAAVKSHAENQLTFFLMPFTEYYISREALKATPYIGISGKFEAEMIMKLDEKVASIPSSYGFGFDKEPIHHILKSLIRCYMPDSLKNRLGIWKLRLGWNQVYDHKILLSKHPFLQTILDVLNDIRLPINWGILFKNKSHFERSIFIGYLLYRFSDKLYLEH